MRRPNPRENFDPHRKGNDERFGRNDRPPRGMDGGRG